RLVVFAFVFFFSSRRRHTRFSRDWSSDVCSSDLELPDPGTDNAVDACNTDNAFNLFNALGGTPDAGGVWTDEDGSGAPIAGDIVDLTSLTAGDYDFRYTITTAPCAPVFATVTVTVIEAPDAGADNTVDACNSETAFDLFASLNGTPDAGGAWADLSGSGATITGNTVDLTGLAAGSYQFEYTVLGTAPCANATAVVTVDVTELPDPGTDNAVDACNTDNAFNLFNALGGTPDAGGVWTDEDGSGAPITGDLVDLTGLPAGDYDFRYTITTAPCAPVFATVTVTVIEAPDAGADNTVDACNSETAFDLFASLNGTPDAGGTWTDLSGSGATITGDEVDLTTLAAGSYQFQYTVTGTAPCANATAVVTVNVTELPDPGTDNAVDACNTDNAFNLFNALGGTPDAGGVWTDEDGSGAPITGDLVDLTGLPAGDYDFRYTITTAPCAPVFATVTVTVIEAPDAGADNTVDACNSETAFDLFASLNGTSDAGGAWADLSGSGATITGNTVDLTGLAAGSYQFEYTVLGTAPC